MELIFKLKLRQSCTLSSLELASQSFHMVDWCKLQRIGASLSCSAAEVLESIEVLKLDWCKARGFRKGKLGGRVSENVFASWVHLAKWFCSMLPQLRQDPASCDSPLKSQSKQLDQCREQRMAEKLVWFGAFVWK